MPSDTEINDTRPNLDTADADSRPAASVLFEAGDLFDTPSALYDDDDATQQQQLFGTSSPLDELAVLSDDITGEQQRQTVVVKDEVLCQQPNRPSESLSFGSSEEVLALLQNEIVQEHVTLSGTTPSNIVVPASRLAINDEISTAAFSNDVLQQLWMMIMTDHTSSGHQLHSTLPSIAETSSTAITQTSVIHIVPEVSECLKLQQRPTQHSVDSLVRVVIEGDVVNTSRRASTGSVGYSAPFRAPQVNMPSFTLFLILGLWCESRGNGYDYLW